MYVLFMDKYGNHHDPCICHKMKERNQELRMTLYIIQRLTCSSGHVGLPVGCWWSLGYPGSGGRGQAGNVETKVSALVAT